MRNVKKRGKGQNYVGIVLIILVISILFGFLFDFLCTRIEYAIYKKPEAYQGFVTKYATEYGVPENIVYAVMKTESGFDSSAISDAGAVGLMQLMPETFLWLSNDILRDRLPEGMLRDPETSIKYGTYYLSMLYKRYLDWDMALAAYNAGPGNVDEWLGSEEYNPDADGIVNTVPFKETANYIKKVKRTKQYYDRLYQ